MSLLESSVLTSTRLEEKLLEDDGGFKAFGIYGMGGSGKTTLAQQIYKTERVRSEFSKRIWVSLSHTVERNEPEIGVKVVKIVLKALRNGIDGLTSNADLDELLAILKGELKLERYLIVLDDVWIIHEFRDSFSEVLKEDPMGGVLIVTGRLEEVGRRNVGKENLFRIPLLNKEDCWKIFMDTLYELDGPIRAADIEEQNKEMDRPILAKMEEEVKKSDHPILEEMEKEIEEQFHGLPLAAKTLGKIIRKKIILVHPNWRKWGAFIDKETAEIIDSEKAEMIDALMHYLRRRLINYLSTGGAIKSNT